MMAENVEASTLLDTGDDDTFNGFREFAGVDEGQEAFAMLRFDSANCAGQWRQNSDTFEFGQLIDASQKVSMKIHECFSVDGKASPAVCLSSSDTHIAFSKIPTVSNRRVSGKSSAKGSNFQIWRRFTLSINLG